MTVPADVRMSSAKETTIVFDLGVQLAVTGLRSCLSPDATCKRREIPNGRVLSQVFILRTKPKSGMVFVSKVDGLLFGIGFLTLTLPRS